MVRSKHFFSYNGDGYIIAKYHLDHLPPTVMDKILRDGFYDKRYLDENTFVKSLTLQEECQRALIQCVNSLETKMKLLEAEYNNSMRNTILLFSL